MIMELENLKMYSLSFDLSFYGDVLDELCDKLILFLTISNDNAKYIQKELIN